MSSTYAKLVCTLGPASDDHATVAAMADAGMRVARLNASHGSRERRGDLVELVRAVEAEFDHPIAVMVDLQGPEIRTAELDEPVTLDTGDEIEFVEDETVTPETVGVTHALESVEVGDRILLDDGRIETVVTAIDDGGVAATVHRGGDLGSRQGVNVPGVTFDLDPVPDRDRREIDRAIDLNVDLFAASYVRNAADVLAVRQAVETTGGDQPVVAKVERSAAVDAIEEIIDAAYGVMIARGDLGVECPMEDVPMIQKRIVRRCRAAGVPAIVATEMLDSMVHATRPTRAEASDVANAVLDGADAVMLSAETAVGDRPVAAVEAMARIVARTEASGEYAELRESRVPPAGDTDADSLARAARFLARDVDAAAVAAASESGYTARKAAKYRPGVPIVAATPQLSVYRELALSWGVRPMLVDVEADAGALIQTTAGAAVDCGVADHGDTVVVLTGTISGASADTTNTLKLHIAADVIARGLGIVAGQSTGQVSFVESSGAFGELSDGAILMVPEGFESEFEGDLKRVGGILAADSGQTGYPAIVARELGVPMVGGISIDEPAGTVLTMDGDRGVVYRGNVTGK